MFLSLFFLASQSTSFFIHQSIIHPFILSVHPVLPYLGIWELAYITFSRVYFSPATCLLRDGIIAVDLFATTLAYRLEELYWSLVFWPILLRDAMIGFPSFASDIAVVILRFFLGITSCHSVDFLAQRQPNSRKNTTRETIRMAPNSETNGNTDTTPPISSNGDARVRSTPRISLREASPPAYTPNVNTGSTTTSPMTTTVRTLLPDGSSTRARSERSNAASMRGLTPSKRNKLAAFPSPPTISSPSPTLRSPSAVFTSTPTHQTILITLPIDNVSSSSSHSGTIGGSTSSESSIYSTMTIMESSSPSPSPSPSRSPSPSPSPKRRLSPSSTTPISSPRSSMLKFSTPPSPLRSKAKRIHSRKRTPATTGPFPISPIHRSPTPYPIFASPSRASASLLKMTSTTPTTPKSKTRSDTAKTIVVTSGTPTPKSKSQHSGRGNRNTSKRGSAKGNGSGNTNAHTGGGVSKAGNGGKMSGMTDAMMENRNERSRRLV